MLLGKSLISATKQKRKRLDKPLKIWYNISMKMKNNCWVCEKNTETDVVSFRLFIPRRGWQKNERDICPKCLKNMQDNDEDFRDVKVVGE